VAAELGCADAAFIKFRQPRVNVPRLDLELWPREDRLLRVLRRYTDRVPAPLHTAERYSVHTYVEGEVLEVHVPPGKRIDAIHVDDIIQLFRVLVRVPVCELPPRPPDWPSGCDTAGFFKRLVRYTDDVVRRSGGGLYDSLFASLGVPADSLDRLALRAGTLTPRPLRLVHADLHRGNIIVPQLEAEGLHFIDWEFALFGDPVYDLAVHLRRMRYPQHDQRAEVRDAWCSGIAEVAPECVDGIDADLGVFTAYLQAHSVYTDVIRVARKFAHGHAGLSEASEQLGAVLEDGHEALWMPHLLRPSRIEQGLRAWDRSYGAVLRGDHPSSSAIHRSGSASGSKPTLA
jgi:aminoglycoside phosphotransferase (APT) family kinase protein